MTQQILLLSTKATIRDVGAPPQQWPSSHFVQIAIINDIIVTILTFFHGGVELRHPDGQLVNLGLEGGAPGSHGLSLDKEVAEHLFGVSREAGQLPDDVGQGAIGHTLQLVRDCVSQSAPGHPHRLDDPFRQRHIPLCWPFLDSETLQR